MNDRGQTAYDYLLGTVLLLVTIITVLSLFPQVFGPFIDPVTTDREKMADRMATEVIDENSTMGTERTVDLESMESGLDENRIDQLKKQAGVPELRNVEIIVQNESGDQFRAGDQRGDGEPAATVTRHFRSVTDGTTDCRDGCQLVVRVW